MNAIIHAYQNNQGLSSYASASHIDLFDALMWACEHNAVPLWEFLKTTQLNPLQAQELPLVVAIENQSFEMVEHLAPVFNEHIFAVLRYFLWTHRDRYHVLMSPLRKQYLSVLLPHISYSGYTNKNEDLGHLFIALTAEECSLMPSCTKHPIIPYFISALHWCYDVHHINPTKYPDPVEKTRWLLSTFAPQQFYLGYQDIQKLMASACKFLCFESFKAIVQHNPKCEVPEKILPLALSHLPKTQALDLLDVVSQNPVSGAVANEVCRGIFENMFSFRVHNFDDDIDQRMVTTLLPYIKRSTEPNRFWTHFVQRCSIKMKQWLEDNKVDLGCPDISWESYRHILSISYLDPLCAKHSHLRNKIIKKRACLDPEIFKTPVENWLDPQMFDALVESKNVVLIEKALKAGATLHLEHFNAIADYTDVSTTHRLFTNHILNEYGVSDIIEQLNGAATDVIVLLDPAHILDLQKLSIETQQEWAMAAIRHNRLDWLEIFVSQRISSALWKICAEQKHFDSKQLDQILDILLRHCDPWENNSQVFIDAVHSKNLHMAQRLAPLCDPTNNNSCALSIAIEVGADNQMLDFLLQYCNPRANNAQALKTALYCNLPNTVVKLLAYFPSVPQLSSLGSSEQELLDLCIAQKQSKVLRSTVQTAQDNTIEKKHRMQLKFPDFCVRCVWLKCFVNFFSQLMVAPVFQPFQRCNDIFVVVRLKQNVFAHPFDTAVWKPHFGLFKLLVQQRS